MPEIPTNADRRASRELILLAEIVGEANSGMEDGASIVVAPSRFLQTAVVFSGIASVLAFACSLLALWGPFDRHGKLIHKSTIEPLDPTKQEAFFAIDRHVLTIGGNTFRDTAHFELLSSPGHDARSLAKHFHEQLGVPWESVRVLDGPRATGASIRYSLSDVARSSSPNSHVIVYISSHGERRSLNGDLLIACYDTLAGFDRTYVSFPHLVSTLSESKSSRVLLILDLCYSGLTDEDRRLAHDSGIVVISSGDPNRLSFEENGRSVFSSAFLSALANPPTAIASVREIFDITFSNIQNRRHPLQRPELFGSASEDFSIATAYPPTATVDTVPVRAGLPIRVEKAGLLSLRLNGVDLGHVPGGRVIVHDLPVKEKYLIEAEFPGYTLSDTALITSSRMSDNEYVIYDVQSERVPVIDSPLWTPVFDSRDSYIHPNPPEEQTSIKIGTNKSSPAASVSWVANQNNDSGIDVARELGTGPRSSAELRFWARGFRGGERITARVGSPVRDGKRSESIENPVVSPIVLSSQWKEFTIDLSHEDLSSVVLAFEIIVQTKDNPDGAVIYLREIAFVPK